MCTAVTYKTKDFYFGRTLDYEFSYGEEITVTPRNYIFDFRHIGQLKSHYAIIRSWARKDKEKPQVKKNQFNSFPQRNYSETELSELETKLRK